VEVSNGEDNVTKKSPGNDGGDVGDSSAKPIAPSLIRSNAPKQTNPSATDQAVSTTPPVGGRRHKRPPPAPK
jgi:hypothetical protein